MPASGGISDEERAFPGSARESNSVRAAASGSLRHAGDLSGIKLHIRAASHRVSRILAHIARSVNHKARGRSGDEQIRIGEQNSRRRTHLDADSAVLGVAAAGSVRHHETSRALHILRRDSKDAALASNRLDLNSVNALGVSAGNRVAVIRLGHILRSVNNPNPVSAHHQTSRRVKSDARSRNHIHKHSAARSSTARRSIRHQDRRRPRVGTSSQNDTAPVLRRKAQSRRLNRHGTARHRVVPVRSVSPQIKRERPADRHTRIGRRRGKCNSRRRPHHDIDDAVMSIAPGRRIRHSEATSTRQSAPPRPELRRRNSEHAAVRPRTPSHRSQLSNVETGSVPARNRVAPV